MEDWVLKSLGKFVGRSARKNLGPLTATGLMAQSMGHHNSYRVPRKRACLGQGLVITQEGVIPDCAPVRRVFHLTNAIVKYYYSPFYLEAQVPGYHTRVGWLGGRNVAFTRDGRYCAFASDRASDFIPREFFDNNPDLIVCLVIGGTGIPYGTSSRNGGAENVIAWGTEVLHRGIREPLATADSYELFDKYGINTAEHIGPLEAGDIPKVVDWMRDLEASGARGVILKPSESHHRPLKYSLPSALLDEGLTSLELDGKNEEDPYRARLIQAACAATELSVPAGDWDWEAVGRSLLTQLAGVTKQVAKGDTLTTEYSVWLHNKEAAEELLAQLGERATSTSIHQLCLVPENHGWRFRFERRFVDVTASIQRRLSGVSYPD